MSLSERLPSEDASHPRTRLLPLAFAAATFLSALLLFGVQPMFTKMVLPVLGGSPAVWSVAMVFFQALLLLGYLYAHLSARHLAGWQALMLHTALLLAAFVFLPLGLPHDIGPPPDDGQALWLIGVFSLTVGPPFFVLAATAPLLQSWFARSGHPDAGNPYGLYVASNCGSFAALLAYPLLAEPLATLGVQTRTWAGLFAILAVILTGCGLAALRGASGAVGVAPPAPRATWRQRAAWTALAAIPSGLLVSVTAHLSTDVASAPFMWVVPLALFLLTFIIAFRPEEAVRQSFLAKGAAWLSPFAVKSLAGYLLPIVLQVAVHLGLFFIAALICHRRLYHLRPAAEGLTGFYLWMSFGGMLGGCFAGLVAPQLFDTIVEHRILVVAALLCVPLAAGAASWSRQALHAAAAVAIALLCVHLVILPELLGASIGRLLAMAVGFAFLWVVILNRWGPLTSAGAAAAAFVALSPVAGKPEAVTRSFFGVNYARVSADGTQRVLQHGSTVHGALRLRSETGEPIVGRPEPTTYYHDAGGITLALRAARAYRADAPAEVALIGLGAGAMACQSSQAERWTYFEIDRKVVEMARRAELFPFLAACTPDARIVIGDGRLTLQRESGRFDVIILDAFSSDSVPAHLLTREAFRGYAEKLTPTGMIIAHVSNRYLDLVGVAEAAGLSQGLAVATAEIDIDPHDPRQRLQLAARTKVVAMSPDPGAIDALLRDGHWRRADEASRRLGWTDDYADILGAILRKARRELF